MTQKKSRPVGQDQQPLGLKNIKDKALFKSFINKYQLKDCRGFRLQAEHHLYTRVSRAGPVPNDEK